MSDLQRSLRKRAETHGLYFKLRTSILQRLYRQSSRNGSSIVEKFKVLFSNLSRKTAFFKTGFSAKNLDRSLDRFFSWPNLRQKAITGLKDRKQDLSQFIRQDRIPRQDPVLLENLSKVLSPVCNPCFAFLSKHRLSKNPVYLVW